MKSAKISGESFLNMGQRIITICYYLLFFATPLLFTSINHELFEYNKMIFTYLLTTIITGTWIVRMIAAKKLILKRTILDIPILIFLVANILSTAFSIDAHVSWWGYYTRSNGGLLSIITYSLLYFGLISNFDAKQIIKFIKAAIWGGIAVSLYAIPEHFGVSPSCIVLYSQFDANCWVQDVQARVFATLGQPNWLAAYLGMLIFPAGYFLAKADRLQGKIFYGLAVLLMYMAFTFTYSRGATLGLLVGLFVFVGLGWGAAMARQLKLKRKNWQIFQPVAIFGAIIISITLIFGTALSSFRLLQLGAVANRPGLSSTIATASVGTQLENGGTDSGVIRLIVWGGAIEIFKKYPIFGSGVETFAYSYYGSRSVDHNMVSEWDFLYNKAHNEYLNYLANTGIVGFASYMLLIGVFLWWALKSWLVSIKMGNKIDENGIDRQLLIAAITASYTGYLVQNFFGFSVVVIATYFYLFPAILIVATSGESKLEVHSRLLVGIGQGVGRIISKRRKLGKIVRIVAIAVTVILTVNYALMISRLWYADTLYAKGSNLTDAGRPLLGYDKLLLASIFNPDEPLYRIDMGYAAAASAAALSADESSESAELIEKLEKIAVSETEKVLLDYPQNVSNFRSAVRTYYELATIDPIYLDKVIVTFDQAIALAPTDPKLYFNKGLIENQMGKKSATQTIEKAISLKPNYRDAYLGLATILIQNKEIPEAKIWLERAAKYYPNDKEIEDKLSQL
jgi:O-antigen ligase